MKNAERNARIIEMRKAGKWPREIAAELGVSRNVVIGVTNRAGLSVSGAQYAAPRAPRGTPRKGRPSPGARRVKAAKLLTATQIARAKRQAVHRLMYSDGVAISRIAEATGHKLSVVYSDTKGLPRHRVVAPRQDRTDNEKIELIARGLAARSFAAEWARRGVCVANYRNWIKHFHIARDGRACAAVYAFAFAMQRMIDGADRDRLSSERLAVIEAHNAALDLSARERLIVNRRVRGDSLADIGRDLGVSRERVRQIANRCWQFGAAFPDRDEFEGPRRQRHQPRPKARAVRRTAEESFALAHAILDGQRRPRTKYTISDEERLRRADRMRRVAKAMWAERAAHVQ